MKTVYRIKITGKKYNENYTFTEPTEGSIKEEVAEILEEMKKGNIDKFEILKEA
jgi:hypothetical protein